MLFFDIQLLVVLYAEELVSWQCSSYRFSRCSIIQMTMGAPNTAVTVLILNSVGEKTVLAIQSQSRQNAPPPKKQAGITRVVLQFEVSSSSDVEQQFQQKKLVQRMP